MAFSMVFLLLFDAKEVFCHPHTMLEFEDRDFPRLCLEAFHCHYSLWGLATCQGSLLGREPRVLHFSQT
jgi:hypothetical protein